jgi:small subunit ribosomal protein S18
MSLKDDRQQKGGFSSSKARGGRNGKRTKLAPAREQTQCRFCRRKEKYVDYKDIETLSKLITNRGKIYSRKRSGNCAACQRKVQQAIKRARYIGLLPFTS